jgi:uncharacterized protein YggE
MDTGITVSGVGTASAPPNVMNLELGAEVTAPQVQLALDRASEALDQMRRVLLGWDVAAADLSSGDVSVWPKHDDRQQVTGYTATLRMSALLRNLGTAGALVSQTVAAGGDAARVFGMVLRHAEPSALLGQAREAAWKDAAARAGQYAELAGRTLGPVLSVLESGAASPPRPLHGQYLAMAAPEALADLPIEPGIATVTVSVDVRWELG